MTAEGTTALAHNWPRLWHEGNFAGAWSAAMDLVTSLALIGLLVTGLSLWVTRQRRRRARRPELTAPA